MVNMNKISMVFYSMRRELRHYRIKPVKFKFPERGKRDDFIYEGTFHEAIGPILAVAQLFGIMPVRGIMEKNPSKLKFCVCSFRFLLCIIYLIGTLWITSLDIYWIAKTKLEFGKIITLTFDLANFISLLCFLLLAKKWPQLMRQWQKVEKFLPQLKYQLDKQKMAYKIKMISLVILFSSISEHLLTIIVGTHGANNCPTIRDPIKAFFIGSFPQVFRVFPYSGALGIFTKYLNVISTFTWSFTDLFVIIVSVGLSSKFSQINNDLMKVKGKRGVNAHFWLKYRAYYREIVYLVGIVDIAIAKIVLISISNNLFFICVQLLRSLDKKPTFAHTFYFWISLAYMIGRTLAVSLYSAEVNDLSKKPLEIFRSVSREDWSVEVKRFNEEVANDSIALSGNRFFYLTRKLMLSVAGTIVTYELVLIQFHQDDQISDWDPCLARNQTATQLVYGG